ncbi:2-succinyl-6-hydroxy-2,4-cyclohexadiene-1-carboxylate synthase [Psychrobacillus sp. FSL H8-0484]|uniref:2-succinyl-6-hydroxy-2, 4-cyclohexadiene-1-carboxylate synthase n=1 Tax=Psychrobacillus sp. FSL H8-0484 TaxID=2921390 RepID=UPI0030F62EF8
MNVNVHNINMHMKRYNIGAKEKVIFLHGFTGSSDTWKEVITYLPSTVEVLTVDLVGHGQSSKPEQIKPYTTEEQIEALHELLLQLKWSNFTLIGYSMGGRLALAYASKYPVAKLILESSSPGLASEDERVKRKRADELLAERITNDGIVSFVDFWEGIPLFHSQKSLSLEKQQKIRAERLAGSEVGFSNSLRGFSTGVQPSYWDKLVNIKNPTILITGELDQKFYDIAKEMQKLLPNCHHKQVNDVGHAIHVENAELFATIVKDIILKEDE